MNGLDVGETMFYMRNNVVNSAPIQAKMVVENLHPKGYASTPEQKQSFMPFGDAGIFYASVDGIYPENKVFASKEKLLASL